MTMSQPRMSQLAQLRTQKTLDTCPLSHCPSEPCIATRYDKLARNFLAGIQLACAIILLN